MINANELRVGNWLQCKYGNGRISVICDCPNKKRKYIDLSNLDLPIGSFSCEFSFDELDSIPLTPDLLIALGCKALSRNEFMFARYSIRKEKKLDNPCWEIYLLANDATFNWLKNIRHVHQLQNFIFALTGKELEIKLLTPTAP